MCCCPISDLKLVPPPIVGKTSALARSTLPLSTPSFHFSNPNPPKLSSPEILSSAQSAATTDTLRLTRADWGERVNSLITATDRDQRLSQQLVAFQTQATQLRNNTET